MRLRSGATTHSTCRRAGEIFCSGARAPRPAGLPNQPRIKKRGAGIECISCRLTFEISTYWGGLVGEGKESAGWDEFRAGWRVLLVSVLGVMVSVSVVPIYAIGAFVKPLQLEFGWSRGAIQYALTAYFVGALFAAVLCGWLLRRFEVR